MSLSNKRPISAERAKELALIQLANTAHGPNSYGVAFRTLWVILEPGFARSPQPTLPTFLLEESRPPRRKALFGTPKPEIFYFVIETFDKAVAEFQAPFSDDSGSLRIRRY